MQDTKPGLIHCSTCPRAYHINCIQPNMAKVRIGDVKDIRRSGGQECIAACCQIRRQGGDRKYREKNPLTLPSALTVYIKC